MRGYRVNVKFVITYNTNRISYYTNNKDKIPLLNHSFVVHGFKCPGCNHYVGKTERTLFERSCGHGFKDKNSVVINHIVNCDQVNFIKIFSRYPQQMQYIRRLMRRYLTSISFKRTYGSLTNLDF